MNKAVTDVEETAGPSQGLGRDLERLTTNQKACENCLVGKQNSARQNRSDSKPLMLIFHHADMSSCGVKFDFIFCTLT